MSILYGRGCGVDVSGEALFRQVTFALEAGDKVGLVGPNGAGKTTLLKACLGEWPLESGQVYLTGSVGFLPQNPVLEGEETVWEGMLTERADLIRVGEELRTLETQMSQPDQKLMQRYAALTETFERQGGYALEAQVRRILAGLDLSEERDIPIRHLSGGQKTRLALAKLLLRSPEILVLDEPTNHLDISALEWLENYLREYAGTVLVVSHDRYFLNRVVHRILHLEQGELHEYKGNYTEYELQRALAEKTMAREAERVAKKIAHLEEYIRRNKAGVNARQARGRETQLQKIVPVHRKKTARGPGVALSAAGRSGERVLDVQGLALSFGEKTLFSGVDLSLRRGERVALLGRNGVGKTSLLKAILHKLPYRGMIRIGANVLLGYYSQEHEGLNPANTVIDEIRQASSLYDPEIRSLLARYGFRQEEVFKPVSVLSGGEKSRLALCKLFLGQGNFLLLDEPTNHLDAQTREVLEEALIDYEGTILAVSHDRYFLDKLAGKVAELFPGGLKVYEGNYTRYLEAKQAERLEAESEVRREMPEARQVRGEQRRTSREEQKREKKVRELEDGIADLESKLHSLEEELAGCSADYEKAMALHQACEEIRAEMEEMLQTWAELGES
ncbi:putative ABC transporter ATP-binding protein YbiT [Peptococcaceae bacterium CEB3]|nr:putative ABC transporter ATP-binding protein YbiT [Peptococcaceae bacterium CEB3]